MSEFNGIRDTRPLARPTSASGLDIEAGSPAHYNAGKWDGEFYATYTHVECHAAALEIAKLNDLWGEEWPWFQHMDDSEFEHHPWLLEHYPIVADRLGLKTTDQPVKEPA